MNSRTYHSFSRFSQIAAFSVFLAAVPFTHARPHSPQAAANTKSTVADLQAQAERGDSGAQYRYAKKLLSNHPSPADIESGLKFLRASVAQNNPNAEFYLGYLYEHGQFIAQDYGKAFQNYEAATQVHYPPAENNLASLYQHGQGVPKNEGKAFDWYLLAAQHGDPVGQINLASLFFSGVGVPRSEAEAFHWLRLSANSGLPEAESNLAYFYFKGVSVEKDYTEAARLVRLAAQQGLPSAQTSLGYLYEQGKGVPLDYVTAYTWYSRAIAGGDNSAASRRTELARIMTHHQLDSAAELITAYSSQGPMHHSSVASNMTNSFSLLSH